MNARTIDDMKLQGKKALIRVDFNVPVREGKVQDDARIVAALPSIRKVLEQGAAAILMSHLGRPKGEPDPAYSLRPVAARLSELLGREVLFAADCVGPETEELAAGLEPGQVLLLENLRFHPGEKTPDKEPDFAEKLACLGDCYINDAFGTAHRAHSSMVAVAERFSDRAAGYLMAKEIDYFGRVLTAPPRPMVAILGGAKVSDKILLIKNLLDKVDKLVIGGAMAYTFLKAQSVAVGSSRVEEDRLDTAAEALAAAQSAGVEVLLPVDHICGREFAEDTEVLTTEDQVVPEGWMGLDIGPGTAAAYTACIREAAAVIWNGPMGVFEWEPFADGTMAVAEACVADERLSIVGGGDSASAAKKSGLAERFSHISTGGGASLELLEGKQLPGLAALSAE